MNLSTSDQFEEVLRDLKWLSVHIDQLQTNNLTHLQDLLSGLQKLLFKNEITAYDLVTDMNLVLRSMFDDEQPNEGKMV